MTTTTERSVPSAPGAAVSRVKTPHRKNARALIALAILTAPALGWYAFFMAQPAVNMFVVSFKNWPDLLSTPSFTGTSNYHEMFSDPVFWAACRNTAIELFVVLAVMIPASFMLGYYLSRRPRGHRLLRVLFFTPALLSVSARAMVFVGVFAPGGLTNGLLGALGLNSHEAVWLADPSTALGVVIFVDLWAGIGFTAILFAARMTYVPPDVYEAAELDGAGHWRKMWGIAFPVIKDYVGVVTMLQFLWTLFYSATTVLLLTQGGPGTSSTTLSYMVYSEAFIQSNIGYSQAVGVVLFLVGLVGMLVIRRAIRQNF